MRTYQINALDISGRILFAQPFRCRDDLEALTEGERCSRLHPVEIRDGSRLVARVKLGNSPLNSGDRRSL